MLKAFKSIHEPSRIPLGGGGGGGAKKQKRIFKAPVIHKFESHQTKSCLLDLFKDSLAFTSPIMLFCIIQETDKTR